MTQAAIVHRLWRPCTGWSPGSPVRDTGSSSPRSPGRGGSLVMVAAGMRRPPVVDEDDVRRIALSLPETTEKSSYGTPGFRVKDRLFARIREEGDVLVLWCADEGEKTGLITADPDKFFTTPHYDGYPLILVRFEAIDVPELTELVTDSWRLRAPKRLVSDFDR